MTSLEQELKTYFKAYNVKYKDHTNSNVLLDFELFDSTREYECSFFIDAKEKRQKYNEDNWKASIPQEYLFIINEADVLKALKEGYDSCFIVRDNTDNGTYYFFPIIDLCAMPKQRVDRQIYTEAFVRKWMIDLRNARMYSTSLDQLMVVVLEYMGNPLFSKIPPFVSEIVPVRGTKRKREDFFNDYNATR